MNYHVAKTKKGIHIQYYSLNFWHYGWRKTTASQLRSQDALTIFATTAKRRAIDGHSSLSVVFSTTGDVHDREVMYVPTS